MNSNFESKREECPGLPKGWTREEIRRPHIVGLASGRVQVVYYSPTGKSFRTKAQLARYLGDTFDLSTFDFQTGGNKVVIPKTRRKRRYPDYSRQRVDLSLVPPIRQTASIFKQPVTLVKTQESIVKNDFKHGDQEKPKQLLWEKRLEGLRACHPGGQDQDKLELPKGLEAVGPGVSVNTVLQSVATALHVNQIPIMGQTSEKANLVNNPGAFINPEQPLIRALEVRDDDIRSQETKVEEARKRLRDALATFYDPHPEQ